MSTWNARNTTYTIPTAMLCTYSAAYTHAMMVLIMHVDHQVPVELVELMVNMHGQTCGDTTQTAHWPRQRAHESQGDDDFP